jgi:hypothetical protein
MVGLFAYPYRAGGRLQTQAIDDANVFGIVNAGTTSLSYTHTAAGRMTQRSESGVGANSTPTELTYDSNGMESSDTTPGATLSGFEFSAEHELLGFASSSAPLGAGVAWAPS